MEISYTIFDLLFYLLLYAFLGWCVEVFCAAVKSGRFVNRGFLNLPLNMPCGIAAALLHDVVEDTEYTVEDMERIFGPKIAKMVDGLTKMSGVFNADTSEQAEYLLQSENLQMV